MTTINRNPTIARHRAGIGEDMIVWEKIDTSNGQIIKTIPAAVIDDSDNLLIPSNQCLRANAWDIGNGLVTPTLSFSSTPVIVGTDSGWIAAWADSGQGIYFNAIGGSGGIYYPSFINPLLNASQYAPATFPSIAWGNDQQSGSSAFSPKIHCAWEQKDSGGFTHIWHQSVYVAPFYSSHASNTYAFDTLEQVSERDNPWIMLNTNPCISVDGTGNNTGNNIARIVWHAQVLNGSAYYDRVRYRERRGSKKYGAEYGFASGARGFLEPAVFVSPTDTAASSLVLSMNSSENTMHQYVFGSTNLHSYSMAGEHATLAFAQPKNLPQLLLYQTTDSAYQAGVAANDSLTVTLTQTRQVNTVAIESRA